MDGLVVGVALDGAGSHPAAWRRLDGPAQVLDPGWFLGLVGEAERLGVDLVVLDDSFDGPTSSAGGLPFGVDGLLPLATAAAVTTSIGLLATVTVTHTEPFHVSKNLATLDLVSRGRAAWRVAVSTSATASERFGRRDPEPIAELVAEADDVVDTVGRLWDSWEDDAVVRQVELGRYVDRDRLHYVDVVTPRFSVRGPSITPRPPQGQVPIAVDVTDPVWIGVAARRADLVLVPGASVAEAASRIAAVRAAAEPFGGAAALRFVATVRVAEVDDRRRLDAAIGVADASPAPGRPEIVGTGAEVASRLDAWVGEAGLDGVLVELDALPSSLAWFGEAVLPELRRRRGGGPVAGATLRDRLGLERPVNRYAEVVS